jgi:hypothetical protein
MDTIQPVDGFVKDGFARKMTEQFRAPSMFVSSPDALKNLKVILGNKQPEYPYIFLRQQSVGLNTESYNGHRLVREGIPVQFSKNQFQLARVLPVKIAVEITFITNKQSGGLDSVDGFVRRYLFACRNGSIAFTVGYGLTSLPITYTLDETVNTSPRENPAEAESVYQVVTNATVHGYVSEPVLGTRGRIQDIILSDEVRPSLEKHSQFKPFIRTP